ncbi:MAG: PAS domain-containing protein [Kiloniellaceae bacterium]
MRDDGLRRTDQRAWREGEAPVSPLGQAFLDFWHRKCPAPSDRRRYPKRSDISPVEMIPLLPYIFMVDVLDEDGGQDFRFRLVGTAIMNIEGEHTGKRLSAMFPDREAYAVLWQQYHDAAAGKVWVRHETLRWQGRDHVDYEVILAPLEDDHGRVAILIGLAHAQDED